MSGKGPDDSGRRRLVGYPEPIDDLMAVLPAGDRQKIHAHLLKKALQPWEALSLDSEVFHTFVSVGRGRGYRVDYGVTELAIIVAGLKKL
jgi:hypothetical protein